MAGVITPGTRVSGPTKVGSYVVGGTSSYRPEAVQKIRSLVQKESIEEKSTDKLVKTQITKQAPSTSSIQPRKNSYSNVGANLVRSITPIPKGSPEGQAQAKKLISTSYEYSFGEKSKQFIGLGGIPGRPAITISEIAEKSKTKGLGGKVVGEVLSLVDTPGEIALSAVTFGAYAKAPKVARIGADILFTSQLGSAALNPKLPIEKRIIAGSGAAFSGLGAALEISPYASGALAKVSPRYKGQALEPVGASAFEKKLFGSQAKVIKNVEPGFDIRIIEKGKGFGFTKKEQAAFLGKKPTITTSADDLILSFQRTRPIEAREGDFGIFFTPTPSTEYGATRASRLKIQSLLETPGPVKDITLLPKLNKPQIVYIRNIPVTKSGLGGTAKAFGYPTSSELEVTAIPTLQSGFKIKGTKKGVTTISGQAVGIYEAELVAPNTENLASKALKTSKKAQDKSNINLQSLSRTNTKTYVNLPGIVAQKQRPVKESDLMQRDKSSNAVLKSLNISSPAKKTPQRAFISSIPIRAAQPKRGTIREVNIPKIPKIPYSQRIPTKLSAPKRISQPRANEIFNLIRFQNNAMQKIPKIKLDISVPKPPRQKIPKVSFTPQYTPDVTSLLFGVKGKRKKRSPYSTGLEIRPL